MEEILKQKQEPISDYDEQSQDTYSISSSSQLSDRILSPNQVKQEFMQDPTAKNAEIKNENDLYHRQKKTQKKKKRRLKQLLEEIVIQHKNISQDEVKAIFKQRCKEQGLEEYKNEGILTQWIKKVQKQSQTNKIFNKEDKNRLIEVLFTLISKNPNHSFRYYLKELQELQIPIQSTRTLKRDISKTKKILKDNLCSNAEEMKEIRQKLSSNRRMLVDQEKITEIKNYLQDNDLIQKYNKKDFINLLKQRFGVNLNKTTSLVNNFFKGFYISEEAPYDRPSLNDQLITDKIEYDNKKQMSSSQITQQLDNKIIQKQQSEESQTSGNKNQKNQKKQRDYKTETQIFDQRLNDIKKEKQEKEFEQKLQKKLEQQQKENQSQKNLFYQKIQYPEFQHQIIRNKDGFIDYKTQELYTNRQKQFQQIQELQALGYLKEEYYKEFVHKITILNREQYMDQQKFQNQLPPTAQNDLVIQGQQDLKQEQQESKQFKLFEIPNLTLQQQQQQQKIQEQQQQMQYAKTHRQFQAYQNPQEIYPQQQQPQHPYYQQYPGYPQQQFYQQQYHHPQQNFQQYGQYGYSPVPLPKIINTQNQHNQDNLHRFQQQQQYQTQILPKKIKSKKQKQKSMTGIIEEKKKEYKERLLQKQRAIQELQEQIKLEKQNLNNFSDNTDSSSTDEEEDDEIMPQFMPQQPQIYHPGYMNQQYAQMNPMMQQQNYQQQYQNYSQYQQFNNKKKAKIIKKQQIISNQSPQFSLEQIEQQKQYIQKMNQQIYDSQNNQSRRTNTESQEQSNEQNSNNSQLSNEQQSDQNYQRFQNGPQMYQHLVYKKADKKIQDKDLLEFAFNETQKSKRRSYNSKISQLDPLETKKGQYLDYKPKKRTKTQKEYISKYLIPGQDYQVQQNVLQKDCGKKIDFDFQQQQNSCSTDSGSEMDQCLEQPNQIKKCTANKLKVKNEDMEANQNFRQVLGSGIILKKESTC